MKTLALLFFALSLYLLLPIPTHSTFNPIRLRTADKAAAADTTAVLDTNGDEVRPGGEYYIVSAIWGAGGGGLQLVQLDHRTKCASDVIISPRDLYYGNKITITPAADPNATAVTLSTFQSLRFKDATKKKRCVNHVSWTVQHDAETGQDLVMAGEFNSVDSNRFKIEVVDPEINVYKSTYCPFGGDQCSNVGRYLDEEIVISRLALTDYPFTFMIVKA